ncbi:LysR family transcriptional regulator [Vibrio rumoiensis]|uniref:LysR family transcriptional regulator n=1 Tax=Vibrio rumoiensis 1S-45 TaxID=1188252 RepID=A0A1E5DZW0_9VIBR|nr:LysR family transcriptional regulator [Vibrio rumoiensis]OEF23599.1 LysR family transcriptional regulator [Vibrio rumoiensis 1S-45]
MLNPVWLHTFKTLVDVGHFTKTSDKLFMTQPGVSQHIQKLEAACGYDLLIRHNKTFELTEQGQHVYAYAQQLLKNEKDLLDSLNIDDPYQGCIKLSCSGSLALSLFPKLLELQKQNPKLVINVEVAPNQKILHDVQQGNLDLGIVTHKPQESFFEIETLGAESLCLVLPKAFSNTHITIEQLQSLGMVRHPDANHYLSLYLNRCGDPNWQDLETDKIKTVCYINQLSQILLPVAKGIGFTVLPKSAVDSFYQLDDITVHQPTKQVTETLYCISKRHKPQTQRLGMIIAQLHKWLRN